MNAFQQGDGHETEEYDALWRLAASRSERTRRAVFEDFLSTHNSAAVFNEHSAAIVASVGLRTSSLDALRSVSVTGPCETLVNGYFEACSTIARISGEQERLANRIVELLGKATGIAKGVLSGKSTKAIARKTATSPRSVQRIAAEPETQFLITEAFRPHQLRLQKMAGKALDAIEAALCAMKTDEQDHPAGPPA